MAVIDDLLQKVEDPILRDRLAKEIHRVTKHKKFGLVFEEHLPECTPLYDVPVKKSSKVALKAGKINDFYTVVKVVDGIATCMNSDRSATVEIPVDELVSVAEFGEPIYPYLKPIDTVCNAPDSSLWHTLIEADNYHALQLLEYLYAGKVDCIYIDPPYNKENSKDWKYNCNYVDGKDMYRHSKWLSMMGRRLYLAKKLLNPNNSVLIITIDETEYAHLGLLLEQVFPEARIQMISSVINVKGSSRKGSFARSGEYIYCVMIGEASPAALSLETSWLGNVKKSTRNDVRLADMMRHGANGTRAARPNLFYPIFVSKDGRRFMGTGEPLKAGVDRNTVIPPDGCTAVWPIHSDGTEGSWGYANKSLEDLQKKGYLHLGKFTKRGMGISYIQPGWQKRIENGEITITGYGEDGFIQYDSGQLEASFVPGDIWSIPSHNATEYGQKLLQNIIGNRFSFPKSLYAVHDILRFYIADKPEAIVVDFYAGSGTTLHAVNLLNSEDGGNRRCILVTNNEIGYNQENSMRKAGYSPGDPEWESLGIARYVTWPRTVCSIEGHDVNGKPLKDSYLGSDIPMSEGFKSNAAYFKLGFLDRNAVALGRQFKELLPVLWMKAGAVGPCPMLGEGDAIPDMMVLPQNKMAVLNDDTAFAQFEAQVREHPEIETVYIVTDSERGYREMIRSLDVKDTYQLYRNYLDNFKINHRR